MTEEISIEVLPHGQGLPLPKYQTVGSSGMDLSAAVEADVLIEPGAAKLIPTGLRVSMRSGLELQVRPRSGLALKHSISVLNTPGTIDADYRGEIGVILVNFGKEPFTVTRGMRVAQMVLCRVETVAWKVVNKLDETVRGGGGFGHTGKEG